MRKGRISKEEELYIGENVKALSYFQIAEKLDRDPTSIEQFIKRKFKIGLTIEEEAAFDLENRPYWSDLQQQFTDDELKMFKYHWSRIISQFKDDVIPTEELQVLDLIKLELLMNRALKHNKDNILQINTFDSLIVKERSKTPGRQDKDEIFNLERQCASLKASQESLNRDYRDLQDKKNKMLKEMKATREQRVRRIEDSKQSFTGWLSYLINHPEQSRDYGIEMEKMRLAMEKERERLSAFHTYQDGQIDRPFLSAEIVLDDM